MKTFDKKDVFSWGNAEDAKQYIGKYCYFADNLQYLKNQVNQDITFKLKSVFNIDSYPVQGVFCDIDNDYWGLCLSADKVKEVEEPKKWRPFEDHNEFKAWVGKDVGEVIYIRKINFEYEHNVLITELSHESVCLGATYYTYDELFNQYEWLNPRNEWQPFGVEE